VALTTARGPLGTEPAGWFHPPIAPGTVFVEPHPRRIQAVKDGRIVIDTERALLVHRPDRFLAYAFLPDDVGDLPVKAEEAAPGYVRVRWDAVDTWIEEGRPVVGHPPNPYHRIACHPTRRRLRVEIDGTTIVDTDDTLILFETTLPHRLYVDPEHVRTDLLQRSEKTTFCAYKGVATYRTAVIGDTVIDDIAWVYDDPFPEAAIIKGMLSFDPEKVEVEAELPPPY
jgi:uncharacterized protein (DUF427 family)